MRSFSDLFEIRDRSEDVEVINLGHRKLALFSVHIPRNEDYLLHLFFSRDIRAIITLAMNLPAAVFYWKDTGLRLEDDDIGSFIEAFEDDFLILIE